MRNGLYELVIAPEGYPGKLYRGRYCYEHHLVWWKNTGELVVEPMLIHHKNDQKRDNRFENLEKKERAKHSSDHTKERMGPPGYVELKCAWCEKTFQILRRNFAFRRRYTNNHCSRSCAVKNQWRLGFVNVGKKKFIHGKLYGEHSAVNGKGVGSNPSP